MLSCNKKQSMENNGLVGKWKLIEIYNGYANGGDFSWHIVSIEDSHNLEFTGIGVYKRRENLNGNFQQCLGTYQLLPDNNIEVNTNCYITVEKMIISNLTNQNLIIDRSGIEGVIRYKYNAEK